MGLQWVSRKRGETADPEAAGPEPVAAKRKAKVAHPGQTLQRLYMDPLGLGVNQLARYLQVPAGRISTILSGQRAISADTALRLARFFDTSALYWMNLQARYDLWIAESELDNADAPPIMSLRELQKKA